MDRTSLYSFKNHPGNAPEYDLKNIVPDPDSPLRGKTIIFLGSSVTDGFGACGISFADYLAAKDGIFAVKKAINGTTLVTQDNASYIPRMKKINYDLEPAAFVCQLSTNDARLELPLGTVKMENIKPAGTKPVGTNLAGTNSVGTNSAGTNSAGANFAVSAMGGQYETDPDQFDCSTIAGAIEYIICYVRLVWNCPVVFYTNEKYDSEHYRKMVELLLLLQKKWGIGVIDLWNDESINHITDAERALYMRDPVHPTRAGYLKWWLPVIERELERILEG